MKRPIILDDGRTCYECENFSLCFARHAMDDFATKHLGLFRGNERRLPTFLAVLADVCTEFASSPPDLDVNLGAITVTMLIQGQIMVPGNSDGEDELLEAQAILEKLGWTVASREDIQDG